MNTRSRLNPLLVPDKATDHSRGSVFAPVTLIEYGDFECPSCAQAHGAMEIMLAHFGEQLRFVFRHFPLREVHPHAEMAAEAAEAAAAQGKFWPMHDLLLTHQPHLKEKHLLAYAVQVGLDVPRYQNEMRDQVYLQRVQEHLHSGRLLNVRSTPAFFVNGHFADVSFGLQHLHEAIDRVLPASPNA